MSIYIGIDPGTQGGIGGLIKYPDTDSPDGTITRVHVLKLKDATERDIYEWLKSISDGPEPCSAVIEKVSSSPQMGVVSSFTFGRGYGFLRGALTGCGIPFVEVTPQKWQKAMGCMSKGDKNVTKAKAQQLYPAEKITHANADALLLATYCKQNHAQLF